MRLFSKIKNAIRQRFFSPTRITTRIIEKAPEATERLWYKKPGRRLRRATIEAEEHPSSMGVPLDASWKERVVP